MTGLLRSVPVVLLAGMASADAGSATNGLADVEIPADPEAARRGAETMVTLCTNCHALKYIEYRDFFDIGISAAVVDQWRGDRDLDAALSSAMTEESARETFGAVPPDLSLITDARPGGGRYVYSLLTGYFTDAQGNTENRVYPGIAMPDVLGYSFTDPGEQRWRVEQTARDVAAFLVWAAEPTAGFRRTLGAGVMAYLVVLTVCLYLWKRRIWARLDREPDAVREAGRSVRS